MARRQPNVFSLSFLDAITCGFGAVILFYMVINASVGLRGGRMTGDLQGEVDRLESEVLDGHLHLVELRNSRREVEDAQAQARGLARRLIDRVREIEEELATFQDTTLARSEDLNRLKTDLKSLDEGAKRLSASIPSDETPGDRTRAFVGDGDRQYLTGLKVGGKRIFFLVDSSASMLDETIVNIIRRRNMSEDRKIKADKWQQTLATVDWLTTQIPRDSRFQIYTFNESAYPVLDDTDGQWLDGSDAAVLDAAVASLKEVVPGRGTNLYRAFEASQRMTPRPDNIMLLVDGLPTQGRMPPKSGKVSGKQRLKLFREALDQLPANIPVNVILFPMEGDPMAASSFWKLAIGSQGSFLSPPKDWP